MAGSFIKRRFTWNGTALPFPTSFTWAFQDVASSNSGRALSGLMNKEIVATKRKLSCAWKMVPDSEAAQILSAIKSHTYGSLVYPDPFEGNDTTKTFYTGDATASMIAVNVVRDQFGGVDTETFVWDIAFDFIEQ